jgi:GntR family transcriptional regulator of vanillate catabolism
MSAILEQSYRVPRREPAWRGVYRSLRLAILNGDLAPEARLLEADLAESLGVSRTPLREALVRLEADGLIAETGRVGYVVSDPRDSLADAYHLRAAIEGYAVRLAAEKASVEEIAALRENVAQSRLMALADTVGRARLNSEFHHLLATASRSPRLLRAFTNHRELVMTDEDMSLHTEEAARKFIHEHDLIVSAIEMRNGDMADSIMRAHLRHASTLLRQGPSGHAAEIAREEPN